MHVTDMDQVGALVSVERAPSWQCQLARQIKLSLMALTHKDSKGTCSHRMASETLVWSLERCGTSPRDVEVIRPGVWISMEVFSGCRWSDTVPSLGEKVGSVGWI